MSELSVLDKYIMNTYDRQPLGVSSGSKETAIDTAGESYIDFGSGIGVNSLGYCDDEWVNAVCEQVRKLQHTSNYYYSPVQAELSKILCETTGYAKLFFGNSGAEANECAIKVARKYSKDLSRRTILTLENSFHGRTMATLSATGQDVFHQHFEPFLPGFIHTPANDISALNQVITEQGTHICAIMIEFIQGEGGVLPLNPDFVGAISDICTENNILLIADEVQTGCGRTAKFLASSHYGILPDITTLAKGLGGGLPIGVCMVNEKLAGVMDKGTHGSTFGGNPVVCAGALEVVKRVSTTGFLAEVERKAQMLRELIKCPQITDISGKGLMLGVSLRDNIPLNEIVSKCLENGLLVLKAKNRLRFLPPLVISDDTIAEGAAILKNVLEGY